MPYVGLIGGAVKSRPKRASGATIPRGFSTPGPQFSAFLFALQDIVIQCWGRPGHGRQPMIPFANVQKRYDGNPLIVRDLNLLAPLIVITLSYACA